MRIVLVAASALVAAEAFAQIEEKQDTSNLSRPMRTAILFYERGEELQAMDRFMEILTKGDPAERPMANEYINLITRRMNTGSADFKASPLKTPSPPVVEEKVPKEESAAKAPPARPVVETEEEIVLPSHAAAPPAQVPAAPPPSKALMRSEIKAKIRAVAAKSLKEIKALEDVRVVAAESGEPLAIGIPTALLFSSGISFQKSAGKILESLSRLVYALRDAKVLLLPEGSAVGDAKVLDMRRAMGISAHLFSAGVAPARVRVNLLNSQVEIPNTLRGFKGVLIVFVYNEPLGLSMENALGEEGGPPLSLGASPSAFRPDRGEGVIIEFSVSEPPAGVASWKFQLLEPPSASVESASVLQQVTGSGPAFHHIYWNGRRNYFGPLLPPGRYECLLTAADSKNRQRTLRRWIELFADKSPAAALQAPAPPASVPSPAPAAPEPVKAAVIIEEVPKRVSSVEIGRKKTARKTASAKPVKPSSGSYELEFNKGTHQLSPRGGELLVEAARAVSYYSSEQIELTGYAESSEDDSPSLAERRAQMVAGLLINKYQIEPKRIKQVNSKVAEDQGRRVEIHFAGKE